MKTTYKDFSAAFVNAKALSQKYSKTKFGYACGRFCSLNESVYDEFAKKMNDLNVEHASTDEKGNIITKGEGERADYVYSKEGAKALSEARGKLLEQEVEVKVFKVKDHSLLPENLHPSYMLLSGFVFDGDFTAPAELSDEDFISE